MRESKIERKLVEKIEDNGGEAYKFTSSNNAGMPDRMCVLPSGKIVFVEVKRPKQHPRKLQLLQIQRLRQLKQTVIIIDHMDKVYSFINHARKKGWFNHGTDS